MMFGQRDWLFQQEARKPRDVGETLGRFWEYFRHYTPLLIAVALLVIASTFVQVQIPNLMGQAVDCFLAPVAAPGVADTSAANCWYSTLSPAASQADHLAGLGG